MSVHQLFQRLETVGKGAYGSVHKGKHIPSGNIVALKIINLDTPDDDVGDIQREVSLLSQLRDAPNITKYFGCFMDGPRVWIVMEFAQAGSVLSLMKASKDETSFVVLLLSSERKTVRTQSPSPLSLPRSLRLSFILDTTALHSPSTF